MTFLLRLIVAVIFFGILMRAVRALTSLGRRREPRRVRRPPSGDGKSAAGQRNGVRVSPDDVIDVPYDDVP